MSILKFMKIKYQITLFLSIISVIVITLTSIFGIRSNLKYDALGISFILVMTSILFYLLGKKANIFYIITYLLNTVGVGLSISAYYTVKNFTINYTSFLPSTLICIFFLIVSSLLIKFGKHSKNLFKILIILNSIILFVLVIFWIKNSTQVFYSMSFFLFVHTIFYLLFFNSLKNDLNMYKDLSKYSFGIYFTITMIVLVIITEGEFIDLDFSSSKKKSRKGNL